MAQGSTQPESRFQTPSLALAAVIVAAGFLGSRLLGLLRSVIVAEAFGTQPELDAYWVAFRLPDLVFQLLAGATLASAFIPAFARVRARRGEAAAWRLASSVLNLVLAATAVFAVLAFLLADRLVPLLAPGLGEETGRQAELQSLATDLTRVMLISPLLFAVSGMFMGILNARRHFLTPALAPMVYNLSIIVAALVSQDVRALAWGVVAGAALHLLVQLPDLRVAGMAYRLVADWRDAAVREVGALMAPRVLGLAATQVNFYFIAIFFASSLGAGAISALSFAWLITMTPLGVIGMAISTAAFPTLAEQAANADERLAETLRRALRLILYLSLPAGLGLAILAKPLVVVLLQRGAFDIESTDLTAQALLFYAPALFAHSGIEILSRGFYALGDTKTPVAIAVGSMLLNLVLAALLAAPWELRGLALALSLATVAEFVVLAVVASRRIPGLKQGGLAGDTSRMALATLAFVLVTGGALALVDYVLGLDLDATWPALLALVMCGAAGGLAYLGAGLALGLDEARELTERLPRRFGRSRM
ncbi:MAG TPA: murein biosynthesis integral membrane protein MurJ [Dehalococcoidia bacterium]|nr:murein biosynthesis integral membrane protein MurJ [Dehalococcoidia bacterium]